MGSKSEEDQSQPKSQLELPPGFRFFPTDEELVVHYLCNKVVSHALPALIIAEVDLYKFDPWQLPEKAVFGEKEWYFFTPRDRKYPNGSRPNRAAGSGYWKATGADKPITTCGGSKRVGVKKALVFYSGKAPKGSKTNWIMHEYRLAEINKSKNMGTLRLDDWVLCRIYNKKSSDEKISKEKKPRASLDESDVRKGLPFDHQPLNNNMESSEPSSDASSKICNAASSHPDHAVPFLQESNSNTNCNTATTINHHRYNAFKSHPDAAPMQIPELSCFQRINYSTGNSMEAAIPRACCYRHDPEKDSEDVHNILRLTDFNFQKQENAHALGAQSLLNFNFNVEGLHSPFLQQLDPTGLANSSSPYQEYIDSLTAQAGCLQKSYQSDMLFL